MEANSHALQLHQRRWLDAFDAYAACYPAEASIATMFGEFVTQHVDAASRRLAMGHLTGSAWLVSTNESCVLLTHHRKLNRWLQLGGHADGDSDLAKVALREAEEESGLRDLIVEPEIFDLDRHCIPARGEEAEHWHYDVRFVVHARGSDVFSVSEESHALAWCDIATIANDPTMDASLRRMANKWMTHRS
jgi:8-oxo-dGTP pyrophosphatase MutT (NUDIX family)